MCLSLALAMWQWTEHCIVLGVGAGGCRLLDMYQLVVKWHCIRGIFGGFAGWRIGSASHQLIVTGGCGLAPTDTTQQQRQASAWAAASPALWVTALLQHISKMDLKAEGLGTVGIL